jgi:hypothetical protein
MVARPKIRFLSFSLAFFLLIAPILPASATKGNTTRVSVNSNGMEGNEDSYYAVISGDGRFVTFASYATNLVLGDSNNRPDVFVHDRQTQETTRVSVDSDGVEGNGDSLDPVISADGRFVAFVSDANNLVPGDTNTAYDIFLHDRQTKETTRVSVDSSGAEGNGDSLEPAISADGRFVAFKSYATNLVPGDTNNQWDIFVHDRLDEKTFLISISSNGAQGNSGSSDPSISSDGRFVTFTSEATNLVEGDLNGYQDVFVRDRQEEKTSRISVDSSGTEGDKNSDSSAISSDGRFVVFRSVATNLVVGDTNEKPDIFIHDRQTGETNRISVDSNGVEGDNSSEYPAISADARFVTFQSDASNLVTGDTNGKPDVFIHDRQTGDINRISIDSNGLEGNGGSYEPTISDEGHIVAFYSLASNMVAGDTNGYYDIFVYDFSGFTCYLPLLVR